jgi:competence protein ComEC
MYREFDRNMERLRGWMERLRKIAPERFVLLGLLLAAVVLWAVVLLAPPRALEVTVFAVGEGDALLIRAPSGRTVLIDGGSRTQPEVGERVLVPNLLLAGVHKLDAILITHPDSDHINALPAVLGALPVGMLLDPNLPCETDTYRRLLAKAEQKRVPRYPVRAGDSLSLGDGIRLRVLAPGRALVESDDVDNDNSVVCLLEDKRARMLFTGDLQHAGETALLARGVDLRADVLKVAHHGSDNGTSDDFLQAVDPTWAVISTRGAASRDLGPVLGRLKRRGIQVLSTDAHGQIRLQTDGERWRVKTFLSAE